MASPGDVEGAAGESAGASLSAGAAPRRAPMADSDASPEGSALERAATAVASLVTPEALLDTWALAAREDGEACRLGLKTAGYKFRSLPDAKQPDRLGCGIPHGVVVWRGPTGVSYDPPVMIDCSLARALSSVETIVQEEAERHLRSRIVRIGNLGGFACRPRNYRKGASLSAHAFGSALDVSSFHPSKGQPAIIARDYPDSTRSSSAQDDRRRFLHGVFDRLRRREADLTYAVGPDFNAIHHNHFHIDRGGWHFWLHR